MNKFALVVAVTTLSAVAVPAMAMNLPSTHPGGNKVTYESIDNCGDQLGYMKRVYPGEVLGVDNHYRVWVTELCPTSNLLRSEGNADYLRPTIAKNDVLVDMLGEKGFHADDVIAVRMMGDDTINLYVHRFDKI